MGNGFLVCVSRLIPQILSLFLLDGTGLLRYIYPPFPVIFGGQMMLPFNICYFRDVRVNETISLLRYLSDDLPSQPSSL